MNKWVELLLGLILVIVPIVIAWYSQQWWGDLWNFKSAAWEFLKGGVFWFFVMIGALFIILGLSDLKG
jgi:TRAP-type C4-dicarboxylate transport system permease small subunit